MSRHQVRYAIHGIGIGLTASVVLISGMIMIFRLSVGRHIGHRVPFGFVLFTAILVLKRTKPKGTRWDVEQQQAREPRATVR